MIFICAEIFPVSRELESATILKSYRFFFLFQQVFNRAERKQKMFLAKKKSEKFEGHQQLLVALVEPLSSTLNPTVTLWKKETSHITACGNHLQLFNFIKPTRLLTLTESTSIRQSWNKHFRRRQCRTGTVAQVRFYPLIYVPTAVAEVVREVADPSVVIFFTKGFFPEMGYFTS